MNFNKAAKLTLRATKPKDPSIALALSTRYLKTLPQDHLHFTSMEMKDNQLTVKNDILGELTMRKEFIETVKPFIINAVAITPELHEQVTRTMAQIEDNDVNGLIMKEHDIVVSMIDGSRLIAIPKKITEKGLVLEHQAIKGSFFVPHKAISSIVLSPYDYYEPKEK